MKSTMKATRLHSKRYKMDANHTPHGIFSEQTFVRVTWKKSGVSSPYLPRQKVCMYVLTVLFGKMVMITCHVLMKER